MLVVVGAKNSSKKRQSVSEDDVVLSSLVSKKKKTTEKKNKKVVEKKGLNKKKYMKKTHVDEPSEQDVEQDVWLIFWATFEKMKKKSVLPSALRLGRTPMVEKSFQRTYLLSPLTISPFTLRRM